MTVNVDELLIGVFLTISFVFIIIWSIGILKFRKYHLRFIVPCYGRSKKPRIEGESQTPQEHQQPTKAVAVNKQPKQHFDLEEANESAIDVVVSSGSKSDANNNNSKPNKNTNHNQQINSISSQLENVVYEEEDEEDESRNNRSARSGGKVAKNSGSSPQPQSPSATPVKPSTNKKNASGMYNVQTTQQQQQRQQDQQPKENFVYMETISF